MTLRWTVAAVVGVALAVAVPAVAAGQGGQSNPPECVNARIVENSGNGPVLYVQACGTGGQGDAPLADQVASTGPLIVDGGPLTAKACTRAHRCVILWPLSPAEGTAP